MPQKLRLGLFAWLALLVTAAPTTVALADSETQRIGSQTGTPFELGCEPGEAIAGWHYNSRDRLFAIWPMCVRIDGEGRPNGPALKAGQFAGVEHGIWRDPIKCGSGQALRQMNIGLTPEMLITTFRATCHGPGTAPALTKSTIEFDGTLTASGIVECPTKTYATALVGTVQDGGPKQGLTSLGLRCRPITEFGGGNGDGGNDQANRNDDRDDGGGGPGGLNIELDIGPDGIQIGNGGRRDEGRRVRFAEEPTTVYARKAGREIAYLDEGERVTIVECEENGEGWCRISRPREGWVWGGDLN